MKHLILCRELPPAPYAPGGIGTYAGHISRALAERGETVHVIGQRWSGAPKRIERLLDGRLIIHRISADDKELYPSIASTRQMARAEVVGMLESAFPHQWFSWCAAGLAERLVEDEGIDVIEAQEWEAPLYYFMVRRALGLGPSRKPPCITHLHSPTETIYRHNEWPLGWSDYLPMKRLEDYVIKAADAHICPSDYLARQAEDHYGLGRQSIRVIPLPMGKTQRLERDEKTWVNGSICYFGRLEPRKGLLEWAEAAIEVGKEDPTINYEFIGTDTPFASGVSVGEHVKGLIPPAMTGQFHFRGQRPRAELLQMLSAARIAVVPSRWENFPNSCLEAMASGLPVIATRNGGMARMIDDGRTGWLVDPEDGPLADRLAATLRRALATPPDRLREMGREAAKSITSLCDNVATADRHIAYRAEVAARGAERSSSLPTALPWPERVERLAPPRREKQGRRRGIAVVVCALEGEECDSLLSMLAEQTRQPVWAALVSDGSAMRGSAPFRQPASLEWHPIRYTGRSLAVARNLGMKAVPANIDPLGWLFLDPEATLAPFALAAFESVLAQSPETGIVAGWHKFGATGCSVEPAMPAFPYQWLWDEIGNHAVYRSAAIKDAGGFDEEIGNGQENWELSNAILASGWAAARLPALMDLSSSTRKAPVRVSVAHSRARRLMLARFPEQMGAEAASIIMLAQAHIDHLARPGRRTPVQMARALVIWPLRKGWRLFKRIRRKLRRA